MNGMELNCAGMGRRDFLQVGLGGMLGVGLADLLRAREAQAGKKINCILVWLDGGPSHYETFDPKPDAPKEIRGEFGTMKTNGPGGRSISRPKNGKTTLLKTDKKETVISFCNAR